RVRALILVAGVRVVGRAAGDRAEGARGAADDHGAGPGGCAVRRLAEDDGAPPADPAAGARLEPCPGDVHPALLRAPRPRIRDHQLLVVGDVRVDVACDLARGIRQVRL